MKRKPTLDELEAFAEEAIDLINQRTLNGLDLNRSRFQLYSKEYADKKGFSRNSVDLFLEGDMLDSLDYEINENNGSVKIFLAQSEVPKGYNHHKGDTLPRRSWFGLTPQETTNLTAAVDRGVEEESRVTLADIESAIASISLDLDE